MFKKIALLSSLVLTSVLNCSDADNFAAKWPWGGRNISVTGRDGKLRYCGRSDNLDGINILNAAPHKIAKAGDVLKPVWIGPVGKPVPAERKPLSTVLAVHVAAEDAELAKKYIDNLVNKVNTLERQREVAKMVATGMVATLGVGLIVWMKNNS